MNTKTDCMLFLVIVLASLLTGCMGATTGPQIADWQVVSVQMGQVLYGVGRALSGGPGTEILQQGERYVFVWASEGNKAVAFFGLDLSKGAKAWDVGKALYEGGNLANCTTARSLVDYLKTNGWAAVNGGAVPVAVKTAITLLGETAMRVPFLIVFPAGQMPNLDDFLMPTSST